MKNYIAALILLFVLLIACNNSHVQLKDTTWAIYDTIYSDSTIRKTIYNFAKNDTLIIDKYQRRIAYKQKVNSVILNYTDTAIMWTVIKISADHIKMKAVIRLKDTLLNRSFDLYKIPALKPTSYDPIIVRLAKITDITAPDTLADGTILFHLYSKYSDEIKIKGAIDKTLQTLPKIEKLNQYEFRLSHLYNYYEYETIDLKLTMENSFDTNYKGENELNTIIWINEK